MSEAEQNTWNNQGHIDRVTSDVYVREMQDIIAPLFANEIGQDNSPGPKLIHDIGGYNGLLLSILLQDALDDSWRGVVTDITRPTELVDADIEFHQVASSGIEKALQGRKADATVSCNTFHVIANDELAKTIHAVKATAKEGSSFVTLNLHPITHRRQWSDFAGRDEPHATDRRGVFVDDYRPETVIPHGFVPNTNSYPRTVESHVSMCLSEGLQLKHIAPVHLPPDYAHTGAGFDDRYRDSLKFLPSYLLTSWRLP